MNKKKLPKKSVALIAAALLLFAGGNVVGTQAQLSIFSEDYNAEFELDHLDVALVENGDDTIAQEGKALITPLANQFEPGRVYKEEIAAKNESDVPEYVRLSLRTYWASYDESGKLVKHPELDPSLIELTFDDDAYNNGAWQINDDETTAERRTFYYSKVLNGGKTTAPVVNKLRVNDKVIDDMTVTETKDPNNSNRIIYTYNYEYDGYYICIEADVQSLQVHNVNDAIKSLWGVQNVSASGGNVTVE